jgi:lysine 2,3-aminomutase
MKIILNILTHGDERIGLKVAKELQKLNIDENVLTVQVANNRAFKLRKRFIDCDLNRAFPGQKNGNYEQKLAYKLSKAIKSADLVLDIHSTKSKLKDALIATKLDNKTSKYIKIIGPKYALIMNVTKNNALISQAEVGLGFEYGNDNDPNTLKKIVRDIKKLFSYLGLIKIKLRSNKQTTNYFNVISEVKKPKGYKLLPEIKNYKLIRKNKAFATNGKDYLVAENNFYPILFGEKDYKTIFGFMGKKNILNPMNDDKESKIELKSRVSSINELKIAFEGAGIKKSTKFYKELEEVSRIYPILISPYLFKQCLRSKAIYKQFIPDSKELQSLTKETDPLAEDSKRPLNKLIHLYNDRALLLATNACFGSCRFCTRKRIKKDYEKITKGELNEICRYLTKNKQVKDVIISGGDPLTMSDTELEMIVRKIKKVKSVKIIRIGTRSPISNPARITDQLIARLKKFNPLYVNVHVNHPDEFTFESKKALRKMYNAGLILGSQSVLLKGVNDNSKTIKELLYQCLENGIKPYCIYQCDRVLGTEHFWTNYQKMFEIAKDIVGKMSGLAVPNFAFDCRGSGGKVRILPKFYEKKDKNSITFRTPGNELCVYKNLKK